MTVPKRIWAFEPTMLVKETLTAIGQYVSRKPLGESTVKDYIAREEVEKLVKALELISSRGFGVQNSDQWMGEVLIATRKALAEWKELVG